MKYVIKLKNMKPMTVDSIDKVAGVLLMIAVCEFRRAVGKEPRKDGEPNEYILAVWLEEMRKAKSEYDKAHHN